MISIIHLIPPEFLMTCHIKGQHTFNSCVHTLHLLLTFWKLCHILWSTILILFQTSWVYRLCGPHPPPVMAAVRLTDTHCPARRFKSRYSLYLTLSLPATTPRSIVSHCRPHPGYYGWVCWAVKGFCAPHVFSISWIYPLSGKDTSLFSWFSCQIHKIIVKSIIDLNLKNFKTKTKLKLTWWYAVCSSKWCPVGILCQIMPNNPKSKKLV